SVDQLLEEIVHSRPLPIRIASARPALGRPRPLASGRTPVLVCRPVTCLSRAVRKGFRPVRPCDPPGSAAPLHSSIDQRFGGGKTNSQPIRPNSPFSAQVGACPSRKFGDIEPIFLTIPAFPPRERASCPARQ